ncbi:MAG: flagellar assembly protein FliH [Pseudomonadota bacterium]
MSEAPKPPQSAYQRWEMNSLGDERTPAQRPGAPAPAAAALAAAQASDNLAALREQARLSAREEGLAEGQASGYADGLALGRADAAAELVHLKELALNFSGALAAADERIAADVLELALHLARGMLRQALDVKPELLIPVVREAIEYLPVLQQPAVLQLHPADAPLVRAAIGEALDKGGWRVIDDATLSRGGCKIDTASNQIDASASTRWARLTQALGKNLDWLGP